MKNEEFLREVDAFVAESRDALLRDLAALIAIPSVEGPAAAGAPFGAAVGQVLETALSMAKDMGLQAANVDGYFGYADVPGTGEKQIGIITHLDVVPEGNGWTNDPFTMTEREGYVLGRGVADDKGPAVLSLYTGKFFAQRGKPLPHTLRVMLGTNEETGMRGLEYYLQRFAPPAFCFTPDADFPVCYGEKGNYSGLLSSAPLTGNLVSFEGGVAGNVVPDRATAVVRADFAALQGSEHITLTDAGGGCVRIEGRGKGGHASMPQGTVNAILLVVEYLLAHRLCSAQEEAMLRVLQALLSSTDGSGMGIAAQDDIFGALTCVGGVISLKDGVLSQTVDVRYPTGTTSQEITQALARAAEAAGAVYCQQRDAAPFVTSADTPEVRALIETYNEVTGSCEKPFTMGGGTYARHFPRAVSFGPEEPGAVLPDWVGPMHGADEGISIELLLRALKIYILSVARLMELPLSE